MRNSQLYLIALTVILLSSCSSSKKANEITPIGETRTEINVPCVEFSENTKDAFRATATATSPNQQFAKEKAIALARNTLAQKIEVAVTSLFDNAAFQIDVGSRQEFKETTKAITRQVTDQALKGLNVVCHKNFTLSSGKYEVWIGLEMQIEDIAKPIYDKVSEDEKIRLEYDYEKFKQELQKEIEKKRNE